MLGSAILIFGLLLPLKWGAWDLFWLWVPIVAMGGIALMTVLTRWVTTRAAVQLPNIRGRSCLCAHAFAPAGLRMTSL